MSILRNLKFTRQWSKRRHSSSSASNERLASYVPFPSLHTRSHLFLLMCDKKRLPERWGKGESSKAVADARSDGFHAGTALENKARGGACALPGSCNSGSAQAEGAIRGQTYSGASSDQPLQSLSPCHRGCKHAGISASSQGAQPRERGGQNPGKTLEGDQSKEKK